MQRNTPNINTMNTRSFMPFKSEWPLCKYTVKPTTQDNKLKKGYMYIIVVLIDRARHRNMIDRDR